MEPIDDAIMDLFVLARSNEGALSEETQKEAVRQLKRIARQGNNEAEKALDRLLSSPMVDPLLREVILA